MRTQDQSRLSTLGPAGERHMILYPMASPPLLVAAGLLAKDERCRSLPATPGSVEESHLNTLVTLFRAASAHAPTGGQTRSRNLTIPGPATYSPCLPALRSSTTYPMGSSASVTQLSHPRLHPPRALHASLVHVHIREPRARS